MPAKGFVKENCKHSSECCAECQKKRHKDSSRVRPHRSTAENKRYALKQHNRTKETRLERIGWSIVLFEETYKNQDGKCAICGIPVTKEYAEHGVRTRACADHNHITNSPRGILCAVCNLGLGYLQDSIDLLKKATEYLEKYTF